MAPRPLESGHHLAGLPRRAVRQLPHTLLTREAKTAPQGLMGAADFTPAKNASWMFPLMRCTWQSRRKKTSLQRVVCRFRAVGDNLGSKKMAGQRGIPSL